MFPQPVRSFLLLSLFLAFWSCAYGQDVVPPAYEPARAEPKTLQIKSVRLPNKTTRMKTGQEFEA